MLEGLGPVAAIIIALGLVFLTALWLILPFAVFGTKPLLEQIRRNGVRANALLEEIRDELIRIDIKKEPEIT